MMAPRLLPTAAGQQRQLDVERQQRHEDIGRDEGGVVRIEGARQAQHGATERKGADLVGDHPFAGHGRHLLVIANCAQHPAERGIAQPLEQHEGNGDQSCHDAEIEQVELGRRQRRAERAWNTGDAVAAMCQPGLVIGDHADCLGKPKRHDRQIIPAQPRRNQSDKDPGHRPRRHAGKHAKQDGPSQTR